MKTFDSIKPLREFIRAERARGQRIGFVPTMGALHDGHRSCITIGRRCDVLVVSIFVNPTQFGPSEDFDTYPRTLETDLTVCKTLRCDAVFIPSAATMYPAPQDVWVDVEGLSTPLCGRRRAGHFRGVATVVAKLFNIIEPDVAVFGQKDAQQALVIREMVRQLDYPIEIQLSPIVREPDGLAMSSRNRGLSTDARRRAGAIHRGLQQGRELLSRGERSSETVTRVVREHILEAGVDEVEYVELLDAERLAEVPLASGTMLLAVAATVGTTRLIDNLALDVGPDGVEEVLLF